MQKILPNREDFLLYIVPVKKILSVIVLVACIMAAEAQVKCNLNKAYAWFTVSIPGTQMVDENGNRVPPVPQVNRFIYLDWKGMNKPVIETVYYNNIAFTATVEKAESNTVSVGKDLDSEKNIVIKAKKGYTFWKLELQPVVDKPQDPASCKNIVIKLKLAGKVCTYKIAAGETQLYSPPRY